MNEESCIVRFAFGHIMWKLNRMNTMNIFDVRARVPILHNLRQDKTHTSRAIKCNLNKIKSTLENCTFSFTNTIRVSISICYYHAHESLCVLFETLHRIIGYCLVSLHIFVPLARVNFDGQNAKVIPFERIKFNWKLTTFDVASPSNTSQ